VNSLRGAAGIPGIHAGKEVKLSKDDIRRVPMGHYTRPAGDPLAGRRIVVGAYLVPHPDGLLLFDSGFGEGEDPELDRYYRTVRRPLRDGLRGAVVEAPLDDDPAWVGRLQALDPCRVLLAHDLASVEAGDGAGQGVWSSPTKARRPAW
jgi:hypothetical protein